MKRRELQQNYYNMHLFNMEAKSKKLIRNALSYFYILCIVIGCNTPQDENNSNNTSNITDKSVSEFAFTKDSIIYELPIETTIQIQRMIKNKNVSKCNLGCSYTPEGFCFSFPYGNENYRLSKRDSILFQETKTYLKLDSVYLPIITEADRLFCNIPKKEYYLNEFNYCSVIVNARGEIFESIAF